MLENKKHLITIIGLGYVGLPLAVEFAKKYNVVGYDINLNRIKTLTKGQDDTLEVSDQELKAVLKTTNTTGLTLTTNTDDITDSNIYIITVPTPVDKNNKPDLFPLKKATQTIAKVLKPNDIVIYESTVYPGVTEEFCVPILEKISGLTYNIDFTCGYSPERINPGDNTHTLTNILKVTSGSTSQTAQVVNNLYASIIKAGTHQAASIKIAEAAKVIENAQRDINIAFVNELAKIFNKLDIDTHAVLEAAATKWNFLPFKPGLVGGHCIGVDPYYLAQKAQEVGYHPEIILAGRRLNDSMADFVVSDFIKTMLNKNIIVNNAKVLMLGITFKENCPDIRNSKAIDIYTILKSYNVEVDVYDPLADKQHTKNELKIDLLHSLEKQYDGIIHVVAHEQFQNLNLINLKKTKAIVYDVKGTLNSTLVDKRL